MRRHVLLFLVLFVCTALPAQAQSPWAVPSSANEIRLDVVKPGLSVTELNATALSAGYYLSGRFATSPGVSIRAELPVAYAGLQERTFEDPFDEREEPDASTAVGNPYLGIALGSQAASHVELGVRLPAASTPEANEAPAPAIAQIGSEFRPTAFVVDALSVHGLADLRTTASGPFSLRFYGGPSFLYFTTDEVEDQIEVVARYSAQGWYRAERYAAGLGVSGHTIASRGDSFNELSQISAVFTLEASLGDVRFGVLAKAPLNANYSRVVDVVGGLTLAVPLR